MIVLATIEGLRAVEQGTMISQPTWRVKIEKTLSDDASFEGANLIVRISGCPLHTARPLMEHLPAILPTPLYKHQAYLLVGELRRLGVIAQILSEE